jgi:hypothetical protein
MPVDRGSPLANKRSVQDLIYDIYITYNYYRYGYICNAPYVIIVMKAVGYCRVSTENQNGADSFGLEAQRDAIRRYCQANYLDIIEIYEDPALSGSLQPMERPGLPST